MMISAGRDEARTEIDLLHEFEAENAAIKAECAVEVRDLQVDVADPCASVDRLVLRHAILRWW